MKGHEMKIVCAENVLSLLSGSHHIITDNNYHYFTLMINIHIYDSIVRSLLKKKSRLNYIKLYNYIYATYIYIYIHINTHIHIE